MTGFVLDAGRWYVVLLVLTWGVAPWVRWLCPAFPAASAYVARPVALLAVVWPVWFLSGTVGVPYGPVTLWGVAVLLAASGWAVAVRRGQLDRAWLRSLGIAEAIGATAFLGYAWWRGFSPQILNTEKPMDIALLTSSARAGSMPPADPWLAGFDINYYYLGYLLHGTVSRLAEVPTSAGFNLALATSFSMAVVATYGLARSVARNWASRGRAIATGVLATVFVVVGGNLVAPKALLADARGTIDASWWGGIGWDSSRVVYDEPASISGLDAAQIEDGTIQTINEFPAFSFVLGDLHPHVMALPYTLVALFLAWQLYGAITGVAGTTRDRRLLTRVAVSGSVIGSLYMLNSWDFPTFLGIAAAAVWFGAIAAPWRDRLVLLAALGLGAVVPWTPFFLGFSPPVGAGAETLPAALRDLPIVAPLLTSIGAMSWQRTSGGEFLTVFGVPFAVAVVFLAWTAFGRPGPRDSRPTGDESLAGDDQSGDRRWVGILAGALLLFGLLLGAPVVLLCGIPLILIALSQDAVRERPRLAIPVALFAVAFALVLGTEFVYIQDAFGNRMNTLFKIYYQAWTLFGVGAALAIVSLWQDVPRRLAAPTRRLVRPALASATAIAVLAVLIYPVLAGVRYAEVYGPRTWQGLDGLAYVSEFSTDEEAAIRWLRANARLDDVVLEAGGCSYQPNSVIPSSRVSAFTGIPTVVGWPGHESQWRRGDDETTAEMQRRIGEVENLFGSDAAAAREEYGISLIYVGPYERDGANGCAAAGPYPEVSEPDYPGPGWDVAFESGEVTIYRATETA